MSWGGFERAAAVNASCRASARSELWRMSGGAGRIAARLAQPTHHRRQSAFALRKPIDERHQLSGRCLLLAFFDRLVAEPIFFSLCLSSQTVVETGHEVAEQLGNQEPDSEEDEDPVTVVDERLVDRLRLHDLTHRQVAEGEVVHRNCETETIFGDDLDGVHLAQCFDIFGSFRFESAHMFVVLVVDALGVSRLLRPCRDGVRGYGRVRCSDTRIGSITCNALADALAGDHAAVAPVLAVGAVATTDTPKTRVGSELLALMRTSRTLHLDALSSLSAGVSRGDLLTVALPNLGRRLRHRLLANIVDRRRVMDRDGARHHCVGRRLGKHTRGQDNDASTCAEDDARLDDALAVGIGHNDETVEQDNQTREGQREAAGDDLGLSGRHLGMVLEHRREQPLPAVVLDVEGCDQQHRSGTAEEAHLRGVHPIAVRLEQQPFDQSVDQQSEDLEHAPDDALEQTQRDPHQHHEEAEYGIRPPPYPLRPDSPPMI